MTLSQDTIPSRDSMARLNEKQVLERLESAVERLVETGVGRPFACFWVAQAVFVKRCSEMAEDQDGPIVPDRAAWRALIESEGLVREQLHEAVRQLASANPGFEGVIALNTSERSRDVEDPSLREMLRTVDAMPLHRGDLESPTTLGRAFEAMLTRGAFRGSMAQFATPPPLAQLLARLAEAEDGMSVYDPCAGTGRALLGCALDLAQRGGEPGSLALQGQDYLPKSVSLSKMAAFFCGLRLEARLGDTLADPQHVSNGELRQFDRIVADPPLEERRDYRRLPLPDRFPVDPNGSPSDILLLQHIQAALAPEGRAVVLVREAVLWQRGREEQLRRQLIEEDALEAVVLLGSDVREFSSVSLCALVLRSREADTGPRTGRVLFIDGRGAIQRESGKRADGPTLDDIVSGYRQFLPSEGFSALVETTRLVERDYDLEVTWYTGQADTRLLEFVEAHEAGLLGTIADVSHGGVRLTTTEPKTNTLSSRVVRARDINTGVDLEQLDLALLRDESNLLKPWDIVIAAMGALASTASVVRPDLAQLRVQPAMDLIRVRLHDPSEERAEFVAAYLNSGIGRSWLRARRRPEAISTALDVVSVAETPVPRFDPSIARMSGHVRRVCGRLRELAEKYETAIGDVFGRSKAASPLLRVRSPLAQAEAVDRFVSQVGSLSSIVRTTFPFPLAEGWRRFEMEHAPRARYKALLDLAENLTAFVAILLVADVRGRSGWRAKVSKPITRIVSSEKGFSFGTWGAVLEAAAARPNVLVEDTRIPELWETLVKEGDFLASLDALSKRRNNESHLTGLSAPQLAEELPEAENELRGAFERLLFFSSYPLWKIDRLEYDPLSRARRISFRVLTGDHEVVAQRSTPTTFELGEGLYLMGRDDEPLLVDPWLIFEECGSGQPQVLVPNRRMENGGGEYRSLTSRDRLQVDSSRWSRLAAFVDDGASWRGRVTSEERSRG